MITLIHINGPSSNNTSSSPTIESEDEGFSENNPLTGVTIKGPSGSVRGIKHCVRQSIQSYYEIITNLVSFINRMVNVKFRFQKSQIKFETRSILIELSLL